MEPTLPPLPPNIYCRCRRGRRRNDVSALPLNSEFGVGCKPAEGVKGIKKRRVERKRKIIIINLDTSLSSGSSSSDEYDSSSSSGSSSTPHEYKIVSSKGLDKKLLKWYEDTTDDEITEFKFLKRKTECKASSSTACCDDTSDQEFPDDDDSSDEDFPNDDDSK
uniref:Uncharacterized protein n=1 Tax=Tanacetum cinerariifolium TaxID=118510 RepID=A0A6L2KE46_TANCI|nr:hypothetical protein [Tanacetum cinerariifolium]